MSPDPKELHNSEAAAEAAGGLHFAVLCVQKAVEFNITDHKLHRATKDKELREELKKLTDVSPSTFMFQLGGGCRVVGDPSAGGSPMSSACVGDAVAAFRGTLSNLDDLALLYVDEPQAGHGNATPAEVVCHMYSKIGVELLTKLRGRFAFCMYESKQGRVLAARDGSGVVHLYQGHSPNLGLVISSTRAMLASCSDVKAFAPGDFKYGWHSEPRQFSPIEFSRQGRQSAKEGGRRGSMDTTGERHSIDMSNMNHSNLEGGWRSGSRRGSIEGGRRGSVEGSRLGSRRGSIDMPASGTPNKQRPPNGPPNQQQNRRGSTDSNAWRRAPEATQAGTPSRLEGDMKNLSVAAPEFRPTGTHTMAV